MKRTILCLLVVCIGTMMFAQSIPSHGLKNATDEVQRQIVRKILEKNLLPANQNLVCIPELTSSTKHYVEISNDSVIVGMLVSGGTRHKYYYCPAAQNQGCITINRANWVFIPKEVKDKFPIATKEEDRALRLCQFLGVDTKDIRDTIVFLQIKKNELFRPAYTPEIHTQVTPVTDFRTITCNDAHIENWFLNEQRTNTYPWTRMGYTYDWGPDNKQHFGATEFVTRSEGSKARYVGYMTVKDFFKFYKEHTEVKQK